MYWRNITAGDVVESLPAPNREAFTVRATGVQTAPGSPVFWSTRTGGPTGYADKSFGERYACLAFCAARDVNRTESERAADVAEFERLDAMQREGWTPRDNDPPRLTTGYAVYDGDTVFVSSVVDGRAVITYPGSAAEHTVPADEVTNSH